MLLFKWWHLFLQIATPRKKTGHFSCKYFVKRFIYLSRSSPLVPRIMSRSRFTTKKSPKDVLFWFTQRNYCSFIWAKGKLWIESHMSQIPYFIVHRTQRVVVRNPNTMVKCSSVNLKPRTNVDFHNVLINKWYLWNEF